MLDEFENIRAQVARQLGHWSQATMRLNDLEDFASPSAWDGLGNYLTVELRKSLQDSIEHLQSKVKQLLRLLSDVQTVRQLKRLHRESDTLKLMYLKTETILDFYSDAINTRTNVKIASLMKACDRISYISMTAILEPLGHKTPPILTYIDKGLGASIMKANLRLWDGKTMSPAAAIKVVRHNIYRPTALIHESGHQISHILKWNQELAGALKESLSEHSPEIAELWSGWSSEIAADTFAFVHTGYASIAGLCDVLSGNDDFVFRYSAFDPHPINYLRVLLGIAMCKVCYGDGPWDKMEEVWVNKYQMENADPIVGKFIQESKPVMELIAKVCLDYPMKAFKGKPITYWVSPNKVSPTELLKLKSQAGASIFTSDYWISKEPIRLMALTGYQIASGPSHVEEHLQNQKKWMLQLGRNLQVA